MNEGSMTTTITTITKAPVTTEVPASVHCPICTHTVEAIVLVDRKRMKVRPGQKCARCHSSIDAGFVIRLNRAA